MSGRRGRRLSQAERMLWRSITRHVAPLRHAAPDEEDDIAADAPVTPPAPAVIATAPMPKESPIKPPPTPAPLGRRAKQRVARGKDIIDGRLDLHGLTQAEAHATLRHFLQQAQVRGAKLVLIITGKGGARGEGVLRRQVPLWLRLPEFSAMVIGFENAHRTHGGEGALYVRVRAARRPKE